MVEQCDPPVSLNDIYEIICSRVGFTNGDVGVVNLVLAENSLDFVLVDIGERNGIGDGDTALFFSSDKDGRRTLVQANSKALQFSFDDFLVSEGLEDVEDDEDEIACSGDSNDLPATTFAVICALDNTSYDGLEGAAI